jgi:hypothetical protein
MKRMLTGMIAGLAALTLVAAPVAQAAEYSPLPISATHMLGPAEGGLFAPAVVPARVALTEIDILILILGGVAAWWFSGGDDNDPDEDDRRMTVPDTEEDESDSGPGRRR